MLKIQYTNDVVIICSPSMGYFLMYSYFLMYTFSTHEKYIYNAETKPTGRAWQLAITTKVDYSVSHHFALP